MQEFITRAAAALGVSDTIARQATGALLDLVSKSASVPDMQQLIAKLPGAADLLKAFQPAPPDPPPSGGMFGALGNMVSSATSALGSLGGPALLLEFVSKSGLSPQQGGQFAKMFLDFARQHAGTDLVDRIVTTIPGARSFLG
jgi:hypothetical protein